MSVSSPNDSPEVSGGDTHSSGSSLGRDKEIKELRSWLNNHKCQHLAPLFIENNVTLDLVAELDESGLRSMGITKVGDRLRLELAISSLKAESVLSNVTFDELTRLLNLNLNLNLQATENDNSSNDMSPVNDWVVLAHSSNDNFPLQNNASKPTKDTSKTITFISQDGVPRKANIVGCFNAQSIKRKMIKKLGLKLPESKFDTYIHASPTNSTTDQNGLSILFDVELVTICYSPERVEKHRIILCPKSEYPSEQALETSKSILNKYRLIADKLTSEDLSDFHMPETPGRGGGPPRTIRNFFGQRPPSELISSNLAEYFPDAHQSQLEATVRNSVRHSVRWSKKFHLPTLIGSHSPSAYSISSGDNKTIRKIHTARTIGDVMVNNITAIDEAVNSQESLFTKPPSIYNGSDSRSLVSGMSKRVSIAASFTDDDRHSRIELLSIDLDSDENEDFIDVYGNFQELHESNTLDSFAKGNKKWVQGARIGLGSFGTVYLGMDPITGELMAVKQVCLPDKHIESSRTTLQQSMIEALQHEMTLLKDLNHENIVRYLGTSMDESFLNIFLEYVPGGSVQSMLLSYGPFEEPLIRNFVRQVLIGLSYLHGKDIIHRDIKGANILIDIKGTVKISDFGISKKLTEDNSGGDDKRSRRASLQGSVYWMAPEVVKQTAYTKKADIWSVGCLIVEMFTGKHPFPEFSQMQAIFKIGTHITPQIPEWCTKEAKNFLGRTFELDYKKRPDSVDMLNEPFMNNLIMTKK
ncbi:ATP binding [Scheffersomyces spartinae]|uniref:mitogen-activated protein kinase kinase kinase n=1 Tax=Scheffersomyces spartinae TaxID=45513 RepID=A0A9P8AJ92_9ASCO|nr:ATP binding [Scheffersomyces spartinae]KAG7194624.1 ATP binding [Scheffersomyces spartinae]